jgi:hypothetical protein
VSAHVQIVGHFAPGAPVELYAERPEPSVTPVQRAEMPESGALVFEVDAERGTAMWACGEGFDGRRLEVRAFPRPGVPVDVGAALAAAAIPHETPERIVGARTWRDSRAGRRARGGFFGGLPTHSHIHHGPRHSGLDRESAKATREMVERQRRATEPEETS